MPLKMLPHVEVCDRLELTETRMCDPQKLRRPTPSYLDTVQTDMNASMRGILVDWLVEVCQVRSSSLFRMFCFLFQLDIRAGPL